MKYRTLRKWRLNRTLKQRGGFKFGNSSTPEENDKVERIMLDSSEIDKFEQIYQTLRTKNATYKLNSDERIAVLVNKKNSMRNVGNKPVERGRQQVSVIGSRGNSPAVLKPVSPVSGSIPLAAPASGAANLGPVEQGNDGTRGRSLTRSLSNERPRSASSQERLRGVVEFRKENTVEGVPKGISMDSPTSSVSLSDPISPAPAVIENASIVTVPDAHGIVDDSIVPSSTVTDAPVEGSVVQSGPVDADIIEGAIVPSVPDAREVAFFREKIPGIEPTVFNPKDFNFFAQFRQKLTDFINEVRYIELLRANII